MIFYYCNGFFSRRLMTVYFSSLLICKVGTSLPQLLDVNAKLKNSKKDTVIVFNLLLSNGMIIKEEID